MLGFPGAPANRYCPRIDVPGVYGPGAGNGLNPTENTLAERLKERGYATLRDLKLAESTLVAFTSDNGPWLIKEADRGSAGPLRGGIGGTWEGGVRVPPIA